MRNTNDSGSLCVVQPLRRPEADDVVIDVEGFKERVPDGWYCAKFLGWDTRLMFKQPKVFLKFEIVEHGEYFDKGIQLLRPYRVRRAEKPIGEHGRFVLHAGGDLYRMLVRVLDVRLRTDRITLRPLRHLPLRILTRTVTMDRDHRDLSELAQYSIVDDIVRAD